MPENDQPTHLDLFSGIPVADLPWVSSGPGSGQSASPKRTPTPRASSPNIGPKSEITAMSEIFPLFAAMCSQAEFRALPFPMPGSALAKRMTVISGRSSLTLLNVAGRPSSFLKTLLGSSIWRSTMRFLIWKVKVIGTSQIEAGANKSSRLLCRLAPSALGTGETGFGFVPIPCAPGNGGSHGKRKLKTMLEFTSLFPTPCTRGGRHWRDKRKFKVMRQVGGNLNPQFVEFLMGFPKNWTVP